MKLSCLTALAAVAFAAAPAARAAPDADAAIALAKSSGCTKCHAVDKGKRGPAFQKIAARYKGQADAVERLSDMVTKTPKVRFENGSEEEHKALDTRDAAKVRNLVLWILGQ